MVLECDGKPVKTAADLLRLHRAAAGPKVKLGVFRQQRTETIEVPLREK